MVMHAELTRESAAQAVCPSNVDDDLLGTAGANLSVSAGGVSTSDPAPRRGIVIVAMGSGMSARVRIGDSVTALATDPLYLGPNVWHFPILQGEVVSLIGDVGITTANVTVAMAKG